MNDAKANDAAAPEQPQRRTSEVLFSPFPGIVAFHEVDASSVEGAAWWCWIPLVILLAVATFMLLD